MDYRQLGHSGLRVSSLTLGTMTFGGRDKFANVGTTDVEGATRQIDMCLDAGVNLIDTADVYSGGLSEEIVGRAAARPPRARAARHQGAHADGRRPQRRGALAPPHHPRVRGEPAPHGHRLHRPLPGARVGRRDAARGDARRARPPRRLRQGALHRLLQLRRLARHEGARHLRAARLPALRLAADLLLAAGARRRVRARARSRSTRASASSSGARSPAACCRASTAATRKGRRARAT